MLPPEKSACDAAKRLSTTVRKLPMARSGDRHVISEKKLLDAKYHPIYLEMRNAGLALASALAEIGDPSETQHPQGVFPKVFTPYLFDSRYKIFCYHDLLPDVPPYPPDLEAIPGTVCVVVRPDKTYFLGLVTHVVEPGIFRVFDLSKPFEFAYCCSHDIAMFPVGRGGSGTCGNEGDDVYYLEPARERLDHKLVRGILVQNVSTTECDLLISGTKVRAKAQYVARSMCPFDAARAKRFAAVTKDLSYDPEEFLAPAKRASSSADEKKAKIREPVVEPAGLAPAIPKSGEVAYDLVKTEEIVAEVRAEEAP